MKRSSDCDLSGCKKPVPWYRRISGKRHCSKEHFVQDGARPVSLICERPGCEKGISVWRRAHSQYCSEKCFRHRYDFKLPHEDRLSRHEFFVKLQFVGGFCAVTIPVITAVVIGMGPLRALVGRDSKRAGTTAIPASPGDQTEVFSDWVTAKADGGLQGWSNGSAEPAWKLDNTFMQPTGTVLYHGKPNAVAGTVSVKANLDSAGTATFLLGSDLSGDNSFSVQLKSTRDTLIISAAHIVGGVPQAPLGDYTIARNNGNFHRIRLTFDSGSVIAVVNERTTRWPTPVKPGYVGFAAAENAEFRIYQAELSLHT